MLPSVSEQMPLHSKSSCKNMARASGGGGGANNMHPLSWGTQTEKIRPPPYYSLNCIHPPSWGRVGVHKHKSCRNLGSFPFIPPPPQYVMPPQLQSTCHYIVNHCKNTARASKSANNMHQLSWDSGHKRKRSSICCIYR